MTEKLTVNSERVDDMPLLVAHMVRMELPKHLDTCFPSHGNWQGLSPGWTATCWLAHILSEGDLRLNHAQGGAAKRLETLSVCTGQEVRALDFSDDRLALILYAMSDDEKWATFRSWIAESPAHYDGVRKDYAGKSPLVKHTHSF